MVITDLLRDGVVYAKFGDIRDSRSALSELSNTQPGWLVQFISSREFMHRFKPMDSTQPSQFEGQVMVTVHQSGPKQGLDLESMVPIIRDHLQTFGEILAYAVMTSTFPVVIRVEFYDFTVAAKVLELNCMEIAVRANTILTMN